MPYKNPDRKRQWEREHREMRNARRKEQRSSAKLRIPVSSEPAPAGSAGGGWKTFFGFVVAAGLTLLGVAAGVRFPDSR